MKVLLYKARNGGIYPAYEQDAAYVRKVKYGQYFYSEITQPRNILFHRKFFALLNLVFANQERYDQLEDLRWDITVEAGYYTNHITLLGEVIRKPKSISFASMDDAEFSDFYNKCIDVIVLHFTFDKQDLIDEIEKYFS